MAVACNLPPCVHAPIGAARHGERQRCTVGIGVAQDSAQRPFDLLFVDLNMPILDGMKLIRRVRDDPAFAHTRICVVTTESAAATEEQARALGAEYFLRKPISRRDVERVMAEAFPD